MFDIKPVGGGDKITAIRYIAFCWADSGVGVGVGYF